MMKQLIYLLLAVLLAACGQSGTKQAADALPAAAIQFNDSLLDMGNLTVDQPLDSVDFRFTNTGQGPLVILGAETSCGCTRAVYPQHPIAPAAQSYIRVYYDGRGRKPEFFRKKIRIYSNAANGAYKELAIKGELK